MSPQPEQRYCGPCGEFYTDGDIFSSDLDPLEVSNCSGTECPFCWETGRTVDELAEAQHEERCSGEPGPTLDEQHQAAWIQHQELHRR
jgi:hypothetical protein